MQNKAPIRKLKIRIGALLTGLKYVLPKTENKKQHADEVYYAYDDERQPELIGFSFHACRIKDEGHQTYAKRYNQ